MTVRYVAAARRLYLAEHIADGDTTACGLDLTDQAELWQDIPAEQARRICPECTGTERQEQLL
ncbi:hypothetical protein [Spongiactinospora sp. TRM90649]|uniref:hypothetical protein n=1 Tax=Spongiactinospora sp. TRM90649 TaxID=3031114 RepID=UPI0023F84C35|nr:hypothetical protein [Spongiactinospora sp. TRM90649]MDF5758593.1 hypothetical protein [Spongiactinospora sp. TRM90649]